MKHPLPIIAAIGGLALATAAHAGDVNLQPKRVMVPVTDDAWRFSFAMPAWATWLKGDTGINGVTSHIDLDPTDIIPRIDMAADVRVEAHKGRFSVLSEFLYLSISDGIGSNTVVQKLDVQVDQMMADIGFGWRVVESPRGYLDVIAGVRYTNFHQQVALQPNDERIGDVSSHLVDSVSAKLRTELSESGLRELIARELASQLAPLAGRGPTVPIGPVGGGESGPIRDRIRAIIAAKKAELAAAVQSGVQARVDAIKSDLEKKIAHTLHTKLDRELSRTDDWFDPYVGFRGRYNLNEKFYLTAKADIGGFGVGADLTWQAEAALGVQLSKTMFTEIGYRAIGVDYDHDGLTMDTITHGVQLTTGITF